LEKEKNMRVREYMSKNVITVKPEQSLDEVVKLMKVSKHDGFPVVDNGNVVGMITTRDILLKKGKTAKDVMSKQVVVTFPEVKIIDAARVMFREGFSRIPVVDKETKKLVGIITNTDVIRSHIERATPDKVKKIAESLEKIYGVRTLIRTREVKLNELRPTQNKISPDEFKGREYEIKRGLAEPIIVIKTGNRLILVDGHHRALAAKKLGIEKIKAYVIALSKDIELGLEKTAKLMGLNSLDDIEGVEEEYSGVAEIIGEKK